MKIQFAQVRIINISKHVIMLLSLIANIPLFPLLECNTRSSGNSC